jgi:hypothetical protein
MKTNYSHNVSGAIGFLYIRQLMDTNSIENHVFFGGTRPSPYERARANNQIKKDLLQPHSYFKYTDGFLTKAFTVW